MFKGLLGYAVAIAAVGLVAAPRALPPEVAQSIEKRYSLYASSPTEFFLTSAPVKITFVPDASGTVNEFVLHQDGRTPHALRVEKP